MSVREILTFQFGNYANYVGAHWCNIQETNFSYDQEHPSEVHPDVLYREGELNKRITFTPRLLLVDLKGALGYLGKDNNLYNKNVGDPEILWDQNLIEKIDQPHIEKSPFVEKLDNPNSQKEIDLENQTNKWVDYLIPRYHPRTVNIINEYEHGSEEKIFNFFTLGENLWKTERFSEEFTDKIRAYVEECDLLQGFQVLMDSSDGFSGLATSCIQFIRDEYNKSIITFPVIDATETERTVTDYVKVINTVLCWKQLNENASLFSPLCCGKTGWPTAGEAQTFDNISYKPSFKYHSSVLLATALDTLSIRYRHKKYPHSVLSDVCADLNQFSRKAASVSLSFPFPMVADKDFIDVLDDLEGSLWKSLTPNCDIGMDRSMQCLSLRGISESRLKKPLFEAKEQMHKPAYRCSSVHEMMSLYLASCCFATATNLVTTEKPLAIKDPFPNIFNSNLDEDGNISNKARETNSIKSTPVMSGLHSGPYVANMYESLYREAAKIKGLGRFHALKNTGLEQDEYYECVHNLLDCKEAYEDHYI